MNKTNKQIKLFFLVLLSSIVFCLENPNYFFKDGLSFLAWFSYLPILIIINEADIKTVWLYGGVCGFLSYGFYGYWLNDYHKLGLIIVCGSYFVIYAVLFLLLKIVNFAFCNNSYFIQCIIICAYEHIKTLGFFGFNYGVTGYTQWNHINLIQISDIFGVFGLSYLLIFSSGVVYGFYQKNKLKSSYLYQSLSNENEKKISNITYEVNKEKRNKSFSFRTNFISLSILLVLILLTIIYGKKTQKDYSKNQFLKITAIQNNEDPWKDGIDVYTENIKKLITLTDESLELNDDTSLIVWPETAVVPSIEYQYYYGTDEKRKKIILFLLNYVKSTNKNFIIGNSETVQYGQEKKYYNSALFFNENGSIIPPEVQSYSKIHLVPFSERFPNKKYFPHLYSFLQTVDTHETTPGENIEIFNIKDFYFSTPICFEDTFGSLCSKMYMEGSRCFINLSNDAWAHSKVCQNQHKIMALFRSVENKIPTVRSTASGQTCVIYPNGAIIAKSPAFCTTYITENVPVIDKDREATIYAKYGNIWEKGLILLASVLLISSIITVIIKKGSINGGK